MKKTLLLLGGVVLIAGIVWGVFFYWENLRGIGPAIKPPPEDIADLVDALDSSDDGSMRPGEHDTDPPLKLPEGFSISIFAKNLPGARVMAQDSLGNMWVSQTKEGKISLLSVKDGAVVDQSAVFEGLRRPHGLIFHPQDPFLLYIAEEDKVSRVRVYSEGPPEKIIDLPTGGNHITRTIMFSPENKLLTSIGSTCNACLESDWRRAKVLISDADGSNLEVFASGLRNAVFMAIHFVTGQIWATEMGRDLIGDDIPPDEINILEQGKNYGWPLCYGKNVLDTDFHKDDHVHIRADCTEPFEIPSYIDLQAHSAPLGLAFVPEEGWPEEYWYDLLVAFHGSWNRTEPTGYKIMRIKLDEHGHYLGREDFISGWLTNSPKGSSADSPKGSSADSPKGSSADEGALGRPVDILIQPGGVIYISDDKAGVIYRVVYMGF